MYVFYEHHKSPTGQVLLTEIKLSSRNNKWTVNFFDIKEKTIFEVAKTILKIPPILKRSIDMSTHVWTFFDEWGVQVLEKLELATTTLGGVSLLEVDDLATLATQQSFDLKKRRVATKPEDFFYNYGQPQSTSKRSKEEIEKALKVLMQLTESEIIDKSSYRRAALKYHPDRNNGDGSKMSELNSLWSVYNA